MPEANSLITQTVSTIAKKDSNQKLVTFEAPLQVKYVHHQPDSGAPDAGFNGNTFMFDSGGFGQLNGIPSYCVDMDSGDRVDCSLANGSNAIRWVPQFTIPAVQPAGAPNAGDLTTVVDSDNIPYLVKPLEIEQRMRAEADQAVCGALAGNDFISYTLPDIAVFTTDPFFTNTAVNNPLPRGACCSGSYRRGSPVDCRLLLKSGKSSSGGAGAPPFLSLI